MNIRSFLRSSAGLVTLALCLFIPPSASAQRWTLPDSVQDEIDEVFSDIGRNEPGCAVGVIRDGKLAFGKGYGLANLDWEVPLTTSTVLDIGSVSKQFTATALALLEGDGTLSLDDQVRDWIPELPDYGSPLTIRHLLNHTSGLRDYLTLMDLAGFEWANTFDEFDGVEIIVRQRGLNFEPGSEYLYSNSGYLLLANIVRRASGQSIREFLEKRVFDPLGMAHTTIWDLNTEILKERATGYSPSPDGWSIDHAWNFQMGGDGQVITSVEDLIKWDRNFYDPVVGGDVLLRRLHTQGVLNSGDTIDYALGLTVDEYRGLARVQHGGAWAGFRAMLARYPEQRTSVILLCNRGDANTGKADRIADAVLASDFPEAPVESPAAGEQAEEASAVSLSEAQLRVWEGVYRLSDGPELLRFVVSEGRLEVRQGEGAYPLTPLSEHVFLLELNGQRLTFSTEGGRTTVASRGTTFEKVDVASLTQEEMSQYEGRYFSPELGVSFDIRMEEGGLSLHRPNRDPAVLLPGGRDEFEAGGLGLTFLREDGIVSRLRVFAGRVTGIVFEARAEGGP